ncbi:hypothetical protein D3C75_705170 [compost metagenome]
MPRRVLLLAPACPRRAARAPVAPRRHSATASWPAGCVRRPAPGGARRRPGRSPHPAAAPLRRRGTAAPARSGNRFLYSVRPAVPAGVQHTRRADCRSAAPGGPVVAGRAPSGAAHRDGCGRHRPAEGQGCSSTPRGAAEGAGMTGRLRGVRVRCALAGWIGCRSGGSTSHRPQVLRPVVAQASVLPVLRSGRNGQARDHDGRGLGGTDCRSLDAMHKHGAATGWGVERVQASSSKHSAMIAMPRSSSSSSAVSGTRMRSTL